jgi:hypothetical protein
MWSVIWVSRNGEVKQDSNIFYTREEAVAYANIELTKMEHAKVTSIMSFYEDLTEFIVVDLGA